MVHEEDDLEGRKVCPRMRSWERSHPGFGRLRCFVLSWVNMSDAMEWF